jgi:hypothetical protein
MIYNYEFINAHAGCRPKTDKKKRNFCSFYKKYSLNYCQVLGYAVKVFRGVRYYRLITIKYNEKINDIVFTYMPSFFFYKKNNKWKWISIFRDYIIKRKKIPLFLEEKRLIGEMLYPSISKLPELIPEVRRVKREKYNKIIQNSSFKDIFNIKKEGDCTPYTPGMNFLKLETVDPQKYKF